MFYSYLPQRGLIKVSGEDKFDFLQGMVTNDMRHVADDTLVYACFLTPQGKYLADFFVLQIEDDWYIDVDRASLTSLITRLSVYKLRSRVTLSDVSEEYKILAFWGDQKPPLPVLVDPRTQTIGWRGYFRAEEAVQIGNQTQSDYELWRLEEGLPDTHDFEKERSTMAETNMDLLNAISWNKGCYVGQELTARVEHRGLVKKRLVPIKTSEEITSIYDTPIQRGARNAGNLRSTYKNHALALMRLDELQNGMSVTLDGQAAIVTIPDWVTQP